jgi:hypothetical protein
MSTLSQILFRPQMKPAVKMKNANVNITKAISPMSTTNILGYLFETPAIKTVRA